MTAFARADVSDDWGSISCEIRSVNHRYLETTLKLPEPLRDIENLCREKLRERLGRGKVELSMRLQLADSRGERMEINEPLVRSLHYAASRIGSIAGQVATVDPLEILRWPGVVIAQAPDLEPVQLAAVALIDEAIDSLSAAREREGARLLPLLTDRLENLSKLVEIVRERMPATLERQQQSLRDRFAQASIELEADRLTQEMVLLAQKTDVAEELDRLEAHIEEVSSTLNRSEPVGRRLDFLMQELNREANTLASKSIDKEQTRCAVDAKVLIEQMREQVQNIE